MKQIKNALENEMKLNIVCSEKLSTIEGHYFLSKNEKREEYRKIFAINNLPPIPRYDEQAESEIMQKINDVIDNVDLVVVSDYGYGLLTRRVIELIEAKAKRLAVGCHADFPNSRLDLMTKYRM